MVDEKFLAEKFKTHFELSAKFKGITKESSEQFIIGLANLIKEGTMEQIDPTALPADLTSGDSSLQALKVLEGNEKAIKDGIITDPEAIRKHNLAMARAGTLEGAASRQAIGETLGGIKGLGLAAGIGGVGGFAGGAAISKATSPSGISIENLKKQEVAAQYEEAIRSLRRRIQEKMLKENLQ